MSQLSHAQFPLRRHPHLPVDHRRARTASVADSRGANRPSLQQLRWPASFRNGGRLQIGMVAGFISEWWPASNRNGGRLQIGIGGRIASEFAVERLPLRGRRDYGNTKQGAYMCETDAKAAGDRAAKNEKHP